MLGRGRNAVSSWERGLTLPNVPRLMRMAKILGTLAESLYMEFYATFPKNGEPANAVRA
jgi:transcriptional regulator with XRE-family HTH domain